MHIDKEILGLYLYLSKSQMYSKFDPHVFEIPAILFQCSHYACIMLLDWHNSLWIIYLVHPCIYH